MAEGFKETLLTKLLDSVPVLLILLGVGVVLIGLAGGVTYHSWFVMGEPVARTAACILGVALIALGIVFSRSVKHAPLRAADYSIKIQHPVAGDRVESVDVRGTIERLLPDGYSLRIFRIYPGSDNFVPLGKARIDILKKTWVAERCQIGGKTGDQRALAAYIVGASGEVLIDFHNNAVSVHRKTMDAFRKATGTDTDFLPTIAGRTQDMFECDRVAVVHS